MSVADTTVAQGGTIEVRVENLLPGSGAEFSLHSTPMLLGTMSADADGVIEASFQVPSDVVTGEHTLVVVGLDADGQAATLGQAVTVVGAASPEIPNTSVALSRPLLVAYLGVQVLFVAAITLVAVRRQRPIKG
jgi:hyaluronoglucosaminidase